MAPSVPRLLVLVVLCGCGVGAIEGPLCGEETTASVTAGPADDGVEPDQEPSWPPEELLPAAFQTPPYLFLVDATTVVVSWRATALAPGTLRFGRMGESPTEVSTDIALHHRVTLRGLRPASSYSYEVDIDGSVRRGVFVTPGGRTVRLVHVGEFHAPSGSPESAAFASVIRGFRPHVIVESGDMVDDGAEASHWIDYLRSSAAWISNTFLLPAHSNHVGDRGGIGHMRCLFPLPDGRLWFTTRYGPVEVLTIASESLDEFDEEEAPWIRRSATLANDGMDDPPFLLAAWHHPACSSQYASRDSKREWVMEKIVSGLVTGGGVDLILVGHDKYYERSTIGGAAGGIVHVMTSAGRISPEDEGDNHPECTPVTTNVLDNSILLVDLDATSLAARAVRQDGTVLDAFDVAPGRTRCCASSSSQ